MVVTSEADMAKVQSRDHVCAEYENGYRSKDSFVVSDNLPMDCDNDHSDDPDDWITPEKLDALLPDVPYILVFSRNHMKPKNGKAARPRFHVYFPIHVISDADAYAALKRPGGRQLPPLVIAGAKGWFYESLFTQVTSLGLLDDVLFPGFIAAEELPWWYRGATLFVYPSRFEGFGLPVLEAMASGTPVITSNVSSLPEVAGDAALLVDPDDTAALSDAIASLLSDAALRERLRSSGLQRAATFSWNRTAAETIRVYRQVLGAADGGHHGA